MGWSEYNKKFLILAQSLFCIFDFYYFPPKESIILLGECVIRTLQTSERSSMISQVPVWDSSSFLKLSELSILVQETTNQAIQE